MPALPKTGASRVRRSLIAGAWYPGRADELRIALAEYLAAVPASALPGEVVGLIAPHAGYMYSGPVAAYAYKQVAGKRFDAVAVVSPVHRIYPGPLATSAYSAYETPLGQVPVDDALIAAVGARVPLTRIESDEEHALEIQLPFLQHLLGEFRLLPIMMGQQDWHTATRLGEALGEVIGRQRVLLVASTDLSHFHPAQVARRLDQVVAQDIEAYDPERLMQDLAAGNTEACGGGPVAAVMVAAQHLGANRAVVLRYATSGDITGDQSGVVGYLAAALLRA